jgi:hypothetical protein
MASSVGRARWLAAALCVVLVAAGCGDDDANGDDGGDARPANEAEACARLETITALDAESEEILQEHLGAALAGGDEEEAAAAFDAFLEAYVPFATEELPDLLGAYDGLADEVPEDLRADVELLRDFTGDTLTDLADAETLADVQALFTADPERATRAGAATLRIDEWSQDTCDIVLAN